MRRIVALFLAVISLSVPIWAGIGSHNAMYVGGTLAGLSERTDGKSSVTEAAFEFIHKGGKVTIPCKSVNSLEYGQKAGRRVGLAIAISPLALFSKKRRHYLTIGYLDEANHQQAAVFELGKDVIRPTLTVLESSTGKKVEYQDDEARKSAGGK